MRGASASTNVSRRPYSSAACTEGARTGRPETFSSRYILLRLHLYILRLSAGGEILIGPRCDPLFLTSPFFDRAVQPPETTKWVASSIQKVSRIYNQLKR
jgi:hypothetical protein